MLINSAWAIATFLVSSSRTTRMGRRDDGETPLDLDDLPQPLDFTPPRKPLEPFPPEFLWGAASAAIQVEGCIKNTDWHLFTTDDEIIRRVKGLSEFVGPTYNLEPIDTAVHHRDLSVLKQDLDRAAVLGLNAYRFSIEWARVMPENAEEVDEEALQYYSDAIDAMRERELEPIVTLNHVSLPLWICTPPVTSEWRPFLPDVAVADQGYREHSGWENPDTIDAYVDFVDVVLNKLGAKVKYWITLNEPTSMATIGYLGGIWPPGFSMEGGKARRAYFNLMKAHVRAFGAIKNHYTDAGLNQPKVGVALAIVHFRISSEVWAEAQAAIEAAVGGGAIGALIGAILGASVGLQVGGPIGAAVGAVIGAAIGGAIGALIGALVGSIWGRYNDVNERGRDQADYFYNRHLLDSLTSGQVDEAIRYRESERDSTNAISFFGLDADQEFSPQLDFIGVNYYRNASVHYNAVLNRAADYTGGATFNNDLRNAKDLPGDNYRNEEHGILNDLGWDMFPEGLTRVLDRLKVYDLPIIISENGFAETSDRNRAPYILAHLAQIGRAANSGVHVIGYCYWSLVDNFEWQKGYAPESRFGLFEVVRPKDETDDRYDCDETLPGRTFKRRITEGALALQYFIANNRVIEENHLEEDPFTRPIERFGIMSDDGKSIEPPTLQAGALWDAVIGTSGDDTSTFRLYLTELARLPGLEGLPDPERRKWLGMIFDTSVKPGWIRLANISVNIQTEFFVNGDVIQHLSLEFERPLDRPFWLDSAPEESPEVYRATATVSSTPGVFNSLNGFATITPLSGTTTVRRWAATRALNVGLWAAPGGGSSSLTHLAIRNWEGEAFRPFQLKYLTNFLPDWQPKGANTTWDGSTLSISGVRSFEAPSLTLGTLNATLTGPTLSGSIENQAGASEDWMASRVTEDISF